MLTRKNFGKGRSRETPPKREIGPFEVALEPVKVQKSYRKSALGKKKTREGDALFPAHRGSRVVGKSWLEHRPQETIIPRISCNAKLGQAKLGKNTGIPPTRKSSVSTTTNYRTWKDEREGTPNYSARWAKKKTD